MPTMHAVTYADITGLGLAKTIDRLRNQHPANIDDGARATTRKATTTAATTTHALADGKTDWLTARCALCGRKAADIGGIIVTHSPDDLTDQCGLIGWTCDDGMWQCPACMDGRAR
jgi:hypothetical protein